MDNNERVMKEATPEELAAGEDKARQALEAWVDAFQQFPTSKNFDGILENARAYQDAWMNGRKRPVS